MSGFEIAGVVLAVVPLVLDACKSYPRTNVGKKTHEFVHAERKRREFAGELLILDSTFRYVMFDIFMRINICLTASQREILQKPTTVGAQFFQIWSDVMATNAEDVREALYHTINVMRPILLETESILYEMYADTGIPHDTTREELIGILKGGEGDGTLSITKHLIERFNFAKSSTKRLRLIQQMKENVRKLKTLSKTQNKIAEFVEMSALIDTHTSPGPFLEKVRSHSDRLYHALSDMWQCLCHKSPSAMLRLERREECTDTGSSSLLFSLVLTFEQSMRDAQKIWEFRETEVCVGR
jgi:hypothetical protein